MFLLTYAQCWCLKILNMWLCIHISQNVVFIDLHSYVSFWHDNLLNSCDLSRLREIGWCINPNTNPISCFWFAFVSWNKYVRTWAAVCNQDFCCAQPGFMLYATRFSAVRNQDLQTSWFIINRLGHLKSSLTHVFMHQYPTPMSWLRSVTSHRVPPPHRCVCANPTGVSYFCKRRSYPIDLQKIGGCTRVSVRPCVPAMLLEGASWVFLHH